MVLDSLNISLFKCCKWETSTFGQRDFIEAILLLNTLGGLGLAIWADPEMYNSVIWRHPQREEAPGVRHRQAPYSSGHFGILTKSPIVKMQSRSIPGPFILIHSYSNLVDLDRRSWCYFSCATSFYVTFRSWKIFWNPIPRSLTIQPPKK